MDEFTQSQGQSALRAAKLFLSRGGILCPGIGIIPEVKVDLFDGADMHDDHFNGDAVVDAVVKNLMDEVVGIIQVFKYSVCSPTS